ncbi:MAG: GGDEF-domain containing protein, partial [Thiothrix lacustris]
LPFVLEEIRQAGISPAMLCFEITERVAIHNVELAQKFIETLKGLGCSFSLDDFGTGVSSFSYLKTLAVDYLKIDGSFIKDIATDSIAEAMVRSVNQVGHLMGIQVIAEYVENEQIIGILRDIGVDYGQGYGISKPLPLAEVIQRHTL